MFADGCLVFPGHSGLSNASNTHWNSYSQKGHLPLRCAVVLSRPSQTRAASTAPWSYSYTIELVPKVFHTGCRLGSEKGCDCVNLINTMESAVAAQLHDIRTRFPQVCFCDRCQRDIQALALNALPARYVVTEEGEIYARTAQLRQQYCTDITIALIQAITKVHKHPRHNQCERGS